MVVLIYICAKCFTLLRLKSNTENTELEELSVTGEADRTGSILHRERNCPNMVVITYCTEHQKLLCCFVSCSRCRVYVVYTSLYFLLFYSPRGGSYLIYEGYYCHIKSMDSHCAALVLLLFCPPHLYQWRYRPNTHICITHTLYTAQQHTTHTHTHALSTMLIQLSEITLIKLNIMAAQYLSGIDCGTVHSMECQFWNTNV